MESTIIFKIIAVWALCLAAALTLGIFFFWIVSVIKSKKKNAKVVPFSDEVNMLLDLEDWQLT